MRKKKLIIAVTVILLILTGYIALNWTTFKMEQQNRFYSLMYSRSDKFWAHMCNSVEKFQLMSKEYSGVEFDAIFYDKEGTFEISHDLPDKPEHSLELFLPTIAEFKDTKIWFDFKNLNHENAEAALNELENLLTKYGIDRKRFIIESHDYKELGIFRQHGFYTSFYVTINNKKFFKDEDGANEFRNEIRAVASSGNVDAISFPVSYYELVKSANVSNDLLTWNTHGEKWWHFYKRYDLKRLTDDEQVKVILIEHLTNYDRY